MIGCTKCSGTGKAPYMFTVDGEENPLATTCDLCDGTGLVPEGKNEAEEDIAMTMSKLDDIIRKSGKEFIKTLTSNQRAILVGNEISGVSDADINWDKVNKILLMHPFDYNIGLPVKNKEDVCKLALNGAGAELGIGPWQQHVCKDCDRIFYLNKGEVDFYITKELNIPKRCKECREKRRGK